MSELARGPHLSAVSFQWSAVCGLIGWWRAGVGGQSCGGNVWGDRVKQVMLKRRSLNALDRHRLPQSESLIG